MRRSDRYRLVRAAAERIVADHGDWAEVDLYLQAFGVDTQYNWTQFGESRLAYAIGTLSAAPDDSILEIADDLGLKPGAGALPRDPPQAWRDRSTFRLFISHISEDRDKALRLRDCLLQYRVSGFVAHQDIKPTVLWEAEILRALEDMDAFLAFHTPGFSSSVWTQQEIGFAVARGVRIISFRMGEDPTGFLAKQQAVRRGNRMAEDIAKEVADILEADELTKERMLHAQLWF